MPGGGLLDALHSILIEYVAVVILIFVGELVISVFVFRLLTKAMKLRGSLGGTLTIKIAAPLVHHLSYVVPVIGHILTTVLLSVVFGAVYKKEPNRQKAGCMTGFMLFMARIILHYLVVVLGIMVFAGKMVSDVQRAVDDPSGFVAAHAGGDDSTDRSSPSSDRAEGRDSDDSSAYGDSRRRSSSSRRESRDAPRSRARSEPRRTSRTRDPAASKAALKRARQILQRGGSWSEAMSELEEATRLDPDNAWAHSEASNAYNKLSRHNDAIRAARAALRAGATDRLRGAASYNLGRAHEALGQRREAISAYEASVRARPNKSVQRRLNGLR